MIIYCPTIIVIVINRVLQWYVWRRINVPCPDGILQHATCLKVNCTHLQLPKLLDHLDHLIKHVEAT